MVTWQRRLLYIGAGLGLISAIFAKVCLDAWASGSLLLWVFSGIPSVLGALVSLACLHCASMNPAATHNWKTLVFSYLCYHVIIPVLGKIIFMINWRNLKNPQKYQDEVLMEILKENGNTQFGRDYGLGKITTREEFRQKIPLTTFQEYEDYVDKVANGEDNIMTKSKVAHLCVSSGTTGKYKMYPMSDFEYYRNYMFFSLLIQYVAKRYINFQMGRDFSFRLSHRPRYSKGGISIGGLTAKRNFRNFSNVVPVTAKPISREEPTYFIQAVFSLREPEIFYVQGFSSDLLHAFFKSINKNKERLCKAIEKGYIEPMEELEESTREELNKQLSPEPQRARAVLGEIEKGEDGLAKRLWPNIRFVLTGKSAGFAPAAKILLNSYIKGVDMSLGAHVGTEGLYGCAVSNEDFINDMYTIVPSFAFYEFIKVEDMGLDQPKTYLLEELEVGEMYEMVTTNFHGLYRNRFGDVIKVIGYTNNTPRYSFEYRSGQILNCGLDRTPEKSFYDAIKLTEKQLGFLVLDYTSSESIHLEGATGKNLGRNHYVGYVELESDKTLSSEQKNMFETNLRKIQESYDEFRGINSLGPLSIIEVKPGTFDGVRKRLIGDTPNTQFKMPHVMRRQEILAYLWDQRINDA